MRNAIVTAIAAARRPREVLFWYGFPRGDLSVLPAAAMTRFLTFDMVGDNAHI